MPRMQQLEALRLKLSGGGLYRAATSEVVAFLMLAKAEGYLDQTTPVFGEPRESLEATAAELLNLT